MKSCLAILVALMLLVPTVASSATVTREEAETQFHRFHDRCEGMLGGRAIR